VTVRAAFILAASILAVPCGAADLKPDTVAAFQRYIEDLERQLEQKRKSGPFLWVDETPERVRQVRQGQLVIAPWNGKGDQETTGGLIHDWIGAVFVPGASMIGTLAWVQDYPHHKQAYAPEVLESRLVSRHGDEFKTYMRVSKKKIISVVLDTEHDVRYSQLDPARWYSRSYSTRIAEVQNPGQPGERVLPAGQDHGFLWRLYSYWKFEERDGGVYIECRAVSLTRNVPAGLGWIIEPIIRELPRQSLENTMRGTRNAILATAAGGR